ncbi:hypothetical protein COCNU_14G009950 [Cocos nucifera]|uniref:Uncharacterized protein n=1 Tax=Cocos nucifera TaxID=13894 RepID=A0A8K0IVN3_COCNU|nr:hypothetical protein COCNU_14G009950 [Cocos nucifera]
MRGIGLKKEHLGIPIVLRKNGEQKFFRRRFHNEAEMKFGRVHDLPPQARPNSPSSSPSRKPHRRSHKEGGMKFGRVRDLPGASKAELSLELAIKEAPQKVSQGGGTKFGRVRDLPTQARPNSPLSSPSRKPRQKGMKSSR